MSCRLYTISIFIFLSIGLHAQPQKKNFIYLDQISASDLKGRKIIEFIRAKFTTSLKMKDGREMSIDNNFGYLVTYKTLKGKDLGINGVLIDDEKNQGELVFHPIGTRNGLRFEKITNNVIYLKSPNYDGGGRTYDLYLTCRFMD